MARTPASTSERQLRRTVRDLVALSTLPALWTGGEAEEIAGSLADALLNILALDVVLVRVSHGDRAPASHWRPGSLSAANAEALQRRLAPWLSGEEQQPPQLAHPTDGAVLRAALARFGHSGDHGVVVALSRRRDFPDTVDRLLLGVGANQAATALQRVRAEEAVRRQNRILDTLVHFSSELAAERDLRSIVQTVIDTGTELSGAAFGAFFYNVVAAAGESYMLYALAGARPEDFSRFPMPRNTKLFGPTFRGEATIRIDDVRSDGRYGVMPPHHGLPPGHLPVRSYLATPVISRSGEVIGGLFFGHPEVGVFQPEAEPVVEALAAHAAIAIDNARLYQSLRAELAERQVAERMLREGARRKDEFLAMLGHEIRNPLAPLRNGLEILEHVQGDRKRQREARRMMERQVDHLTRLVDDLLDVSRISRGKVQLRIERLDLARHVRETAEDHREQMATAGLRLVVAVGDEPLWVDGDRVRLAQSLANLLENSRKFTAAGGEVRVTVRRDEDEAVVAVVDEGVGISAEDLPHVFEPFSQSRSTFEHSNSGLGLGLAVVKSLVELHGGTVCASSGGLGQGTEILLRLPLAAAQEPATAEAPLPGRHEVGPDHRVLVIEDNPDSADTLSELLRLYGHRVETARAGEEGLRKAREFRPDVVLCDIGLPGGMDGYQVARALRREPELRGSLLIALTGFGQESDRRRALESGFDAHLTKPADLAALQRLLARRSESAGASADAAW